MPNDFSAVDIALFAVIVLAAFDTGRLAARRLLGEREALSQLGVGLALSVGAIGGIVNLAWRATLRPSVGLYLAAGALVTARLAIGRLTTAYDGPPPLEARERAGAIAITVAATAPMVPLLFGTSLWDEWDTHLPFASSFARGVYPPVYPFFPDTPLTYHIGYDVVVAVARRLTGLRVDVASDVLSTLLIASFTLVAGGFLRRIVGGRVLPYACGAAAQWGCSLLWVRALMAPDWSDATLQAAVVTGPSHGFPILTPVHMFFLQKPMTAGLPLWLSIVWLFLCAERRASTTGCVIAGLYLATLEVVEFPIFAMTCATTMAYAALAPLVERRRYGALPRLALVFVGIGVFAGYFNGGFLANPRGSPLALHLALHLPLAALAAPQPEHGPVWLEYAWQLGIPLLVTPFAAIQVARRRNTGALWLLLFALGSFVVVHLFHYEHSHDIIKFLVLSEVAMSLVVFYPVTMFTMTAGRSRVVRVVCATAIFIAMIGSAPFSIAPWIRRLGNDETSGRIAKHIDHAVVAWMLPRVGARDRVLTSSIVIAGLGGFLTPIPTYGGVARQFMHLHGYDSLGIDFVADAVARALRDLNAEDLARLQIRWLVLGEADKAKLSAVGRARLEESGDFEKSYVVHDNADTREVYEYLRGPPATAAR